jgi:DNA-binding MarR family transcriptional regulator
MRPRPRELDERGEGAAPCAQQILELVPRAMRLLRAEMRQAAGPGLSVPQFRVLAYLGRDPGASLSAVAQHVGVASATASAMVERLVQRRLVSRSGDPAERRRVRLALTAQGAALLDRSRAHARTRVEERLQVLTPAGLAELAAGLARLDHVLGAWTAAGERP